MNLDNHNKSIDRRELFCTTIQGDIQSVLSCIFHCLNVFKHLKMNIILFQLFHLSLPNKNVLLVYYLLQFTSTKYSLESNFCVFCLIIDENYITDTKKKYVYEYIYYKLSMTIFLLWIECLLLSNKQLII